jgi:II/X family phage/plasmid replication protein
MRIFEDTYKIEVKNLQSQVPELMIDTIRFRGDFISLEHLPKIQFELETLIKTKGDVTLFEFTSGQLKGSYDNRISFTIKDMDWVYNIALARPVYESVPPYFICELSLHKFYMGHNVFGFDDDLSRIYAVYDFLEMSFDCTFIRRETVELLRIDLSEVYKYKTTEEVKAIFHGLKNHRRYRTKPSTYKDTGIYYPGTMTTFKIYDKHEEFKAHDFKKLKKNNLEDANYVYDMSKNVVRLECEIHKKKLNELYGRNVFVEDLIMSKIIDLKMVYLKEKQRLIFESKDDVALKAVKDVQEYLVNNLGMRKASALFAFWTSLITQGEEHTRNMYSKTQFYTNKKALKELGVPFYEYGFVENKQEQGQLLPNNDI